MTARLNNRLSSVAFSVTLVAVICWACLAFCVPFYEVIRKDDHAPISALLAAVFNISHRSHDPRPFLVVVFLFAASLGWRIVAAKRLRNSTSRGFDVVQQINAKDA